MHYLFMSLGSALEMQIERIIKIKINYVNKHRL